VDVTPHGLLAFWRHIDSNKSKTETEKQSYWDISGILQAFLVDKLSGTGQQLVKELFARQLHEMTQCKSSGGNLPPSSSGK